MSGRSAVADGEVCQTSIDRSTTYAAEVVVAGRGEHIELRLSTTCVGMSLNGLHQVIIHFHCDVVGIVIIITKEGRAIENKLTSFFELTVDS